MAWVDRRVIGMNHIWEGTEDRLICSEPLEARWFLSGSGDAEGVPLAVSSRGGVHVVEITAEEEDEQDVAMSPRQLPRQVVDALRGSTRGRKSSRRNTKMRMGNVSMG